jgi:hypothetical protein
MIKKNYLKDDLHMRRYFAGYWVIKSVFDDGFVLT